MARGYYGGEYDGMDIARNAMGLAEGLGGLIRSGQKTETGRRELEDDAGIRQAYEHIAQRVGQGGNISALDGDPVMNTRYGIMAMGKFMADRAIPKSRAFPCCNIWRKRTIHCTRSFSVPWP